MVEVFGIKCLGCFYLWGGIVSAKGFIEWEEKFEKKVSKSDF